MALTTDDIRQLLNEPKNVDAIQMAIYHEKWLEFHVNVCMSSYEVNYAYGEYTQWIRRLLPEEKYQLFLDLLRFPLFTNEITQNIFEALEKVYDGKDAYKYHKFVNPEFESDYKEYRSLLGLDKFMRYDVFNNSKVDVNGFVVVDLPEIQIAERPEPYFYFIPIDNVLDFDYDREGNIKWFFMEHDDKLIVYDIERYRVFRLEGNAIFGEPIIDIPHFLGRCPVTFMWHDTLKVNKVFPKRSPISHQISQLDWILFFGTGKKHLDLYAPFPIYSGYTQDCDYNDEDGNYCEGGYIKNSDGIYYTDRDRHLTDCPICQPTGMTGWGSFVEVPIPSQENNFLDLRNPVNVVGADGVSLEYNVKEFNRVKLSIFKAVTGFGGEMEADKAFNKDQVQTVNEGRRNVILSFKKNLEILEKWIDDTICELRYRENYIGTTISYGTDFYWYNAEELTIQYDNAKKSGASDYRLDYILDQIIEVQHKSNPEEKKRALIMKELEPYRHQTRDEVFTMVNNGYGDPDNVAVKLNFSNFINRFERENTDIVTFGSDLPFNNKIELILNELKNYGKTELIKQVVSGGEIT